ncbi:unnamed protein product [Cercopithifilaria johnstoni]|uniref:Uncharacterized protein n=1 Tax=Cercopithifilaria johnstoni TaxID=2874296 RepID=A0A8J2QAV5_9BILA|nr:unnamed protein product [Cercopithifilaria johnstoni]
MLVEDHSFFAPINLTLKKLYDEGEMLHVAKKNYSMTIQHGCIRKIFLPLTDPFCKSFIPVLTNVIQCSCFQSPLLKQACDAEFEKAVRNEGPKLAVPMCFKTSENLKSLLDDKYNFGVLGPTKYIKARTKNYPLCYDMIAIDPYKNGIEHRSGPFDELISYLYNMSGNVEKIRRVMTFTVNVPDSNRMRVHYLFTCFQRENYEPCNGPLNIRNRLLPEVIRTESANRNLLVRSLCHADGHSNRIRCKSRKGCFDFLTVHGFRTRGCIDKIPKIVLMKPKLRLLYTCYNHAQITRTKLTRCNAVRENDSNSSLPLMDGIICCCTSTCRMFNDNSQLMKMDRGYYPFEM